MKTIHMGVPRHELVRWARLVARRFRPEKIILFGSYARGTQGESSDVDLLVVMKHDEPASHVAGRIRADLPSTVSVDVVVRSPIALRRRVRMGDVFMKEILAQGRVLYEADHI